MTLEEMQEKWAEMDAKLDRSLRINARLITEGKMKTVRSALKRLQISLGIESGLWLLLAIALGNFIHNHFSVPALLVSGLAVDIYVLANCSALIRQIAVAGRLDYSQPVTSLEAEVASLRMLRLRYTRAAVLWGIVLWAAAAVVGAQVLFGIDLYFVFGPAWVWSNVAFGVIVAALVLAAARRFGPRLSASSFGKRLADDIAGISLKGATDALGAIRDFERS